MIRVIIFLGDGMIEEIKKMPKVELHLHLDGSVRIETASNLLGLSKQELFDKMVASDKCIDLNEYLTKFKLPIDLLQTKDNLCLVARELGQLLEEQNVIYAEVRFAPFFHTKSGLTLDEVVMAVLDGFAGYNVNLILCMMRGSSFEDNEKIIDLASRYLKNGVVGLDLAGAEGVYHTCDYADLFRIAKEKGIPFTIHAGEADGRDSVLSALDFGAKRLGHGIRCLEDMNLVKRIVNERVLLEICPTSNVQTNVVSEYRNHPIYKLYKKGVLVCVNTDNVTVSNVTLTDEYIKLYKNFGFNIDDFKKMNLAAIEGSFSDDKEKLKEIVNNF